MVLTACVFGIEHVHKKDKVCALYSVSKLFSRSKDVRAEQRMDPLQKYENPNMLLSREKHCLCHVIRMGNHWLVQIIIASLR